MTSYPQDKPAQGWLTAEIVSDEPSEVEARFQDEVLKRARSLESRARGLFAEVLIAESLPGSELGPHAMSRWDLRWSGIEIAVRTTGTVNSYSCTEGQASGWTFLERSAYDDDMVFSEEKRRCWTDVVVLAHHRGSALLDGWTFHVLNADELLNLPTRISPSRAEGAAPAVAIEGLATAIQEAANRIG